MYICLSKYRTLRKFLTASQLQRRTAAHQDQDRRSALRNCDRDKMVLGVSSATKGKKKNKLSFPRSIYRPAVAPLSCAAVKFSPSQAPSDPPLLTSSASHPKNTALGGEAAILVNSAHKGQ